MSNTVSLNSPFKPTDVIEESSQLLAERLANDVAGCLRQAIDDRGQASLVVSGGSTPLPFFKALSNANLHWEKITVTLADERWVDADHEESNEKFVREHLLCGAASAAAFVSLKNSAATPEAGWQECEAAITAMQRPFDVVILGMGGDGHTASLFPEASGLVQALSIACGRSTWPMNPPGASQLRMTLTLDSLLDSNALFLHITGQQKRDIFQQAKTAQPATYPIAAVISAAAERLKVYWAA